MTIKIEGEIKIDISTVPEEPIDGQEFEIIVKVENLTHQSKTININSELHTIYYTGVRRFFIKSHEAEDQIIQAGDSKQFSFKITEALYKGIRTYCDLCL